MRHSFRPGAFPARLRRAAGLLCLSLLLSLLPLPALGATDQTYDGTTWRAADDNYCPESRSGAHSYGSWTVRQAATCTRTGTRVRFCSICGYTQTQTIARSGHSYGSWTITKTATCTRTGTRTRTCTLCGATDTETIKKKSHSFGDWTVLEEPTPFSAGRRSRVCKNCGTEKTESFDPEGTLRRGDKGSAVKELQNALNSHGFNCGKADGAFGKKTEAAVASFETANGLPGDGVGWPGVLELLGIGKAPATEVPLIAPVTVEPTLIAPVTVEPTLIAPVTAEPTLIAPVTVDPGYGWEPPALESALTVTKALANVPENGQFYTEGETVIFTVEVQNPGETALYGVEVRDPLAPSGDGLLSSLAVLPAGGSVTLTVVHTVTALDVFIGCVSNVATAGGTDETGIYLDAVSNEVIVPTSQIAPLIEKIETSTPANGQYYVLNEEIEYQLLLTNPWFVTFAKPTLYDGLFSETHPLAAWETLKPGESLTLSFSYTVTEADVADGLVINTAWVTCERNVPRRDALPVISPVGKPPAPRPDAKKDTCVLTLTGLGSGERTYSLDLCAEHGATRARVTGLTEAAGTESEKQAAWQQAVDLWTADVNELYDTLLSGAAGARASLITADRERFFTHLNALRTLLEAEHPSDPAAVAMHLTDQLMDRCTELCYEVNTAPGSRRDALENDVPVLPALPGSAQEDCVRSAVRTRTGLSYTELLDKDHSAAEASEQALAGAGADAWDRAASLWLAELDALTNKRYKAADAAGRKAIANERVAFGEMLTAREACLSLIYPGHPEIVREMMAELIRARVLDLCGGN